MNIFSKKSLSLFSIVHLSSWDGLHSERSVRHLLAAVLDVHFVLAKIVGCVGGFERTIAIVYNLDFARITVRALQRIEDLRNQKENFHKS